MPDLGEVDRLLQQQRAAHAAYRVAANPASGKPNKTLAAQHISDAQNFLMQAHALDPDHRSNGWSELKAPYEKLVEFYQKYPSIP